MARLLKPIESYQRQLPLLLTLLIATPIIFFQAVRYSYPLGYAGMFTLIAENISAADFALPMQVPHYGPGGIPLVYPPFALYVFALALKLGISSWLYLRIVPALFTLLSIIPFYYLTLELVGSRLAGLIAAILVITAPAVYYTHVWAAGVVRAFALCFCFAGLLFYVRALREFSWRYILLAGIFLGLVLLTHLLYVQFAALVGLACLLAEWKITRLRTAFIILVVVLLFAAPWLMLIINRHGVSSLFLASASHRNIDFFLSLGDLPAALQFVMGNLQHVTDNWFVTALALPGFVLLLIRRQLHLPLAFLFILLMGEASFYTEILAAMMGGAFAAEMLKRMPGLDALRAAAQPTYLRAALAIGVAVCCLLSTWMGLSQIAGYYPLVDGQSLQTADFVRENTDPEATYLFVGMINEAEWFPYLMDRTPVFSPWGSEWKGTYAEQSEILIALRECELQKSWACMEVIQQKQSVSPALLVIPNKRWLIQDVKDSQVWNLIYRGERYLVWERNN